MRGGPATTYDYVVIGGGFYGCCLALYLRSISARVLVVEAGPRLMDRASRVNQARVHTGFHYPRSAATAAGYAGFEPDACLINRYLPGTKLSLHQDRDEADFSAPIVSVSLGLPALFQFGGLQRADPAQRLPLAHGDVVVWGGNSRLRFHGVLALKPGQSLAIFGGGAVGLSGLLGARAIGAGTVIVIEPNEGRRKLALELGATHVIDPKAENDVLAKVKELGGGGVTHAFDTTGIPAVIGVAVETMLPNGMLGLVAVPPPDASLPANMMSMLIRGVGVKFITEGDADPKQFIPQMAAWYKAGKFPFDRLITKFKFSEINEAAHSSEKGGAIKPVMVF